MSTRTFNYTVAQTDLFSRKKGTFGWCTRTTCKPVL